MSVDSGFDDLQVAADAEPAAVREARRRRDVFRKALPTAVDVVEVIPTGSLARGTHKDPIHDVDVVAIFDPAEHPGWDELGDSAEDALEHAQDLINEKLGPNGREGEEVRLTRIQNHAVKCFLDDPDEEGAFTVDVTPGLRHLERGIWIPERENRKWVRSDPEHLNELVASRHAEWRQFAKLVRVLKRWNSDHGAHMKSLLIEVLALYHLPMTERPNALARFFAAAQEAVWSPVEDPAGLCGEIQPDLDRVAASTALTSAADAAARAVEAAAREETRRAMCLWREVFGDIYPEPPGGCGAGGIALIPAAPKRKVVDAPQG